MPYIKQERRAQLDQSIETLVYSLRQMNWTAGDLNYCFYRLMKRIFIHRPEYQTLNDFRGALGNTWDEFYRRVAVPYEKRKQKLNGDV
jgi:hypothetical protein